MRLLLLSSLILVASCAQLKEQLKDKHIYSSPHWTVEIRSVHWSRQDQGMLPIPTPNQHGVAIQVSTDQLP